MTTTKWNAVKLLNNVDHAISLYNEFAEKKHLPLLTYNWVVEVKHQVESTKKEDYVHTRQGNVCTKICSDCSEGTSCCEKVQDNCQPDCAEKCKSHETCEDQTECICLKAVIVKLMDDNNKAKKTIVSAEEALEKVLYLLKKAKKAVTCARVLSWISLVVAAATIILSYYF